MGPQVETLRTVVGSARAECPHLAHQMAAEALGILQDDTGLLPAGFMSRLPPPPVASEVKQSLCSLLEALLSTVVSCVCAGWVYI